MINPDEIKIRLANREDAIPVLTLLERLGLELPREEELQKHWDRLWTHNPYYRYFNEDVVYGWIMEHNQQIVGFFGSIPRVYCFNSTILPVSIASQWGVEKNYREFTHLLCEHYFNSNPIPTKLVTTAINPTGRIFEKYLGKKVPVSTLQTVYMVPLNLFALLAHKYRDRIVDYLIIRQFLKALVALTFWRLRYKWMPDIPELKETDINSFPDQYDLFWNAYQARNKGLLASRDIEFLKWYYTGGDSSVVKKVFLYQSDGKVMGYAALTDRPVKENKDLKRYMVIDVLAENKTVKTRIIKGLIRYAFRTKADVLEFHLPGMVERNEIPTPTLKRLAPQFPVFYKTDNTAMDAALQRKQDWQISPFDGDTCLQ